MRRTNAAMPPERYTRFPAQTSRHASAPPGAPSTKRSSRERRSTLSLRLLRLGRRLRLFELLGAERNDLDLHVRGHLTMKTDLDVVHAQTLDRMSELDAPLLDLDSLRFE